MLPTSCTLSPDSLLDTSPSPISGCTYEGTLDGSKVRIKRVRIVPEGDLQKVKEVRPRSHVSLYWVLTNAQAFYQVVVVWKHLAHSNIVPLLGATTDPLQLISDWMCGGHLTEYITNHPNPDRPSLVRVPSTVLCGALTRSLVIRCRQRPQLPPLLQRDPWRSQRSM